VGEEEAFDILGPLFESREGIKKGREGRAGKKGINDEKGHSMGVPDLKHLET